MPEIGYIFVADSMDLSSFKFLWWGPKDARTCFETECVMALRGHPRSLILAPIESSYATSYRSSIVILVLSCPVSEILQVSREKRPHPYSTRILGVFPWTRLPMLWLRSEGPKLTIRVITFELNIRTRHHVTDSDRQTDERTENVFLAC